MTAQNSKTVAQASGTFTLGGDLTVNRLGFGAMRLTGNGVWGPPADRDECVRVLRRAADLGVNFIDTADSYGPYISEDIIHEALHPYDGLVIATKAGLLRTGPDIWIPLGNPAYLRQECEMSLRRLGVDTIDLFQLHRVDRTFPLAAGPLAAPDGPLRRIAADHHATPSQLALAWLLKRSPVMLPIPGTSKVAHLEENVAAAEITLSDDEFDTLAAAAS